MTSARGGFRAAGRLWTLWIFGAAGGRGPGRVICGVAFLGVVVAALDFGAVNRAVRFFDARRFDLRGFRLDGGIRTILSVPAPWRRMVGTRTLGERALGARERGARILG
ncbi:MAG: hypothetical protein HQ514_00410 [Rhodospirillales bacterium]|nr:hypothetical protein [Rhodospirillales bacterium]